MTNPSKDLAAIDLFIEDIKTPHTQITTLISKWTSNSVKGFFWKLYFHPQNPITNFIMKLKYDRIALELHKELTEKSKSVIVESETKNS